MAVIRLVPNTDVVFLRSLGDSYELRETSKSLYSAGVELITISFWWTVLVTMLSTIYKVLFIIPETQPDWQTLVTKNDGWLSYLTYFINSITSMITEWFSQWGIYDTFPFSDSRSFLMILLAALYFQMKV